MAYSDYGAYIWKNGKFLEPKDFPDNYDSSRVLSEGKWIIRCELSDEEYKTKILQEGHAILVLDNICVSLYKNYGMHITEILDDGVLKKTPYSSTDSETSAAKTYYEEYYNDDLSFNMMFLDEDESVLSVEIRYKDDIYFIIVGSSIGYGWDTTKTSKFFYKSVVLKESDKRKFHWFEYRGCEHSDVFELVNYLRRKDDLDFQKYCRKKYAILPFIFDLLTFDFKGARYHLDSIITYHYTIKYLK